MTSWLTVAALNSQLWKGGMVCVEDLFALVQVTEVGLSKSTDGEDGQRKTEEKWESRDSHISSLQNGLQDLLQLHS